MDKLTAFQRETERSLRQRLGAVGVSIADRKVLGEVEAYIEARVDDVRIWIYSDEACVIGRGIDRVYEKWDFETEQKLKDAFIQQVVSMVDEARGA
jgi:hypothetical protein